MSGWECPVCGLVNAPWSAVCAVSHLRPMAVSTSANTTTEEDR